jgi:transcriptional regulator with XRE-family HTH domain
MYSVFPSDYCYKVITTDDSTGYKMHIPGKPYAETKLAKFLEKRILELRPKKTQRKIAAETGFASVNMLAMIKAGKSRLPLDRVPALAKALEVDGARLFLMAVEQQDNALAIVLRDIFGTAVSRNEVDWLEEIRGASRHTDPNLTARAQKAIRGIFGR